MTVKIKKHKTQKIVSWKENFNLKIKTVQKQLNLKIKYTMQKEIRLMQIFKKNSWKIIN